MSVELLYTSAALGLKQGSRGFCTVLSTAGMPINLATRLEGLSAYRHQFPPNHPDADKNPVSFSHLRFSIGGRKVSILSRISDYGIDYSQRTNKLAHHVVLDAHELTPAGPAWLMEHGSIFRDTWNGQCETPAAGPAIAMQNQSPRVCMEWGHRCGDAGWGGVVADAFLESAGKPLWIVFNLSQSQFLLRLLNESIALLPVDQRWRATFSTYATNLPPDADCKVRCVLQGTDEARLAPARGTVIDLTKPLPAPPATTNVTAARQGPDIPQLPVAAATPAPPPNKAVPAASPSRPQVQPPPVDVGDELNLADDSLQLASLPSLPPTIKRKQFKPKPAASVDDSTSNTQWLKWALVAASIAAVLMLITTIALLVRNTKGSLGIASAPATADTSSIMATEEQAAAEKAKEEQAAAEQAKEEQAKEEQAKEEQAAAEQAKEEQAKEEQAAAEKAKEEQAKKAEGAISRNNNMEETMEPLKGEVMAKQLFDGTLRVKLHFLLNENLVGRMYCPSDELGPRPFKAHSPLVIDDKQKHRLKSVAMLSIDPPEFVVELSPEISDLRTAAKAVRDAFEATNQPVVEWNARMKKSNKFADLFIPILPEPNATDTLIICLNAIVAQLDRVREVKGKLEGNRLKADQDSKEKYYPYLESLATIESNYMLLVSRIESVKTTGEIDSGPIFYFHESEGTTTKIRPLSKTYSIDSIKRPVPEVEKTEQLNSSEEGDAQKSSEKSPKN